MIERCDQPDLFGEQHAVSEHIARHIPDTGNGEFLCLGVVPHLAEMPFDRFPGATGGNRHFLMIVAGRAAGSESIAKPEPIGNRHLIGNIREGGRSLVRRDNEIWIILVMPDDILRRHHHIAHIIVRDIEKAGDKNLVAINAFRQKFLPIPGASQIFRIEASLRANGHDDGVFHHLGLHQAKHFRPEIFSAI